jgi:hypothetical protein
MDYSKDPRTEANERWEKAFETAKSVPLTLLTLADLIEVIEVWTSDCQHIVNTNVFYEGDRRAELIHKIASRVGS